MMWTRYPRLLGLAIALPALPATVLGVQWSLAPGRIAPPIESAPSLVEVPDEVQAWIEDATTAPPQDLLATPAVTLEEVPVVIDEGLKVVDAGTGGEPARIGVFRGDVQMGWVEAAPGMIASLSLDRSRELDELEARIQHENDVMSRRFAEAAKMAEANARRRTSDRQRIFRDPSELAQIIRRTSNFMSRGPQFERPRFVQQLQRERQQVRRAHERRSACRDHGGNCTHR